MQPVVPTLHAIHGYTSAELTIRKVYGFKSLYDVALNVGKWHKRIYSD